MIFQILLALDPFVMIVVTPAAIARSAAMSFVAKPPVPNDEPAEATQTTGR
jgi:hypothetical protein